MAKITFFLPIRSGSERIKNKNTKAFAQYKGGLVELKLTQLLELNDIPILISTNCAETIKIAKDFKNDRIQLIKRPEHLCQSNTSMTDLIKYVPKITQAKHILWSHVTSPFVTAELYKKAIDRYFDVIATNKDSLMSVTRLQEFLWDPTTNKAYNFDRSQEKWPRTQDLDLLYCINSGIFINSRENYLKYQDRIGLQPDLFELKGHEAIDVDWEEDFILSEKIIENASKV